MNVLKRSRTLLITILNLFGAITEQEWLYCLPWVRFSVAYQHDVGSEKWQGKTEYENVAYIRRLKFQKKLPVQYNWKLDMHPVVQGLSSSPPFDQKY